MPLTARPKIQPTEAPTTTGWQKVRTGAGMATRLAGGFLATPGGIEGATIGGGSELLAEFLEGSLGKNSGYRIAAEAGLGAIPLGKTLSAGRAILSAGKSGTFNAVGDLGRQYAEGNFDKGGSGLNTNRLALSTLLGAGVGAGAGKFYKGLPEAAAPSADKFSGKVPVGTEIENLGGGVARGKGKNVSGPSYTPADSSQINSSGNVISGYSSRAPYGPQLAPKNPFDHTATPTDAVSDLLSGGKKHLATTESLPNGARTLDFGLKAKPLIHATDPINPNIHPDTNYGMITEDSAGRPLAGFPGEPEPWNIPTPEPTPSGAAMKMRQTVVTDNTGNPVFVAPGRPNGAPQGLPSGPQNVPYGVTERKMELARAEDAADAVDDASGGIITRHREGAKIPQVSPGSDVPEDLLSNITDPIAATVYKNRIKSGDTARQAYRKAYQVQQYRESRSTPNTIEGATTPDPASPVGGLATFLGMQEDGAGGHIPMFQADLPGGGKTTVNAEQLKTMGIPVPDVVGVAPAKSSSTQAFEDMLNPPPKVASTPSLDDIVKEKLSPVAGTYPDEVMDELKRLSRIYNDPDVGKAEKKAAGKGLAKLRDFMTPKGPKADGQVNPAAPGGDWVADETSKIDALKPGGEKGFGTPDALISAALGLGGAAYGATQTPDDPWQGAAVGAAVGVGAGLVPALARSVGANADKLADPDYLKETAGKIVSRLPQWQRFSMLADPRGMEQGLPALGANAFAGPYGSVMMAGIEGLLKGDPRAAQLLKSAWNPVQFVKGMKDSMDEAGRALVAGEMGRDVQGTGTHFDPSKNIFDAVTMGPGLAMTSGDVYARKLLRLAGYTAEEAKMFTLTSTPDYPLMRRTANWAKGSWLGNMMLPFSRTPTNILEQGSKRIPGLGSIVRKVANDPASLRDQAVEQGLGAGVMGADALLASSIDDETTRKNVGRYARNLGGVYALPAALGYVGGSAMAKGNSPAKAFANPVNDMFPLPTTDIPRDYYNSLLRMIGVNKPKKGDGPMDALPDSVSMKGLRDFVSPPTPPRSRLRARPRAKGSNR